MASTGEGGRKAAATNKEKYCEDFYKNIGRKGGLTPRKGPRGFAAMSHDRLVQVSAIGGRNGKRGTKKTIAD